MLNSALSTIKKKIQMSAEQFAPDPASVANKEITAGLYETFEKDLAEAQVKGLHFYVRNGNVTIYGLVRHNLDRELIVTLTKQVSGVRSVLDNMQCADKADVQNTDVDE